jgi:non-heme chloroperoxidase
MSSNRYGDVMYDPRIKPLARIERFFGLLTEDHTANEFRLGCLIGNLSLELANTSTEVRNALKRILERQRSIQWRNSIMSRKNRLADKPARRDVLIGGAAAVGALAGSFLSGPAQAAASSAAAPATTSGGQRSGSYIATKDGTQIYYKDWGAGRPIVFCHGWPLSSDSWESQMMLLASHGYRAVAHDRRGHGRSSQPWNGNEMNTYADDLATVFETLRLRDAILVGFSTGGGEVARYLGRHGTGRVSKVVLVSAVPPLMLKTAANPGGLSIEVFDGLRAAQLANRSQFYKDVPSGPFYGFNRPGTKPSQGLIESWWMQGMQGGHKNTYDSIKAFSETDFTEDLKKIDVPTLIIHGEDDQIVPIDAAGRASARLIRNSKLIVYPGAPHGLTDTHKDKFNADLLAFIRG